MKGLQVLLVDDNDRRRAEVGSSLVEVGLIPALIDEASCVVDARRCLLEKHYDVLIVDIALPNFNSGEVRPYAGADLIDEVFRSDRFHHPAHVIALTAHENILSEYQDKFRREMVFLLDTENAGTNWKKSIQALIHRALIAKENQVGCCVDVAIITAIPGTEGRAFLNNSELDWSESVELDVSGGYRVAKMRCDGREISLALVSPVGVGLVHAAIITTKVVERLRPKLVVMSGICAGITGISKIGDLILASASWEWQTGKYQEGEDDHLAEPNPIPIDDAFLRVFREIKDVEESFIGGFYHKWPGALPPERPTLQHGPFASGSSVLARRGLLEKIKKQQRKVLAVDMEVHAVYAACFHASLPRPKFFAVKCVSDLADGDKNDNFHEFCSSLSAACVLEFLRKYFNISPLH